MKRNLYYTDRYAMPSLKVPCSSLTYASQTSNILVSVGSGHQSVYISEMDGFGDVHGWLGSSRATNLLDGLGNPTNTHSPVFPHDDIATKSSAPSSREHGGGERIRRNEGKYHLLQENEATNASPPCNGGIDTISIIISLRASARQDTKVKQSLRCWCL